MKSNSTEKPDVLQKTEKGSYLYHWNITETTATDEEGNERTTYDYDEVRAFAPITANKILAAVIAETWDSTYELKVINEYNAAQNGLYDDDEEKKAAKIEAYTTFLTERQALKDAVDSDCNTLGIA